MTEWMHGPKSPGARDWRAIFDARTEEIFNRVTRLASEGLHTPTVIAALTGEQGHVVVSSVGLPELWLNRDTPFTHAICGDVETQGEFFLTANAADSVLVDDAAIEEFGAVAYASVPLHTSAGVLLGCLCVIDHLPRRWSGREMETLRDFAALLVAGIESRVPAVEAREPFFRSLVDGVRDILTVIDPRGTVLYDSPSIQLVLGYPASERVGGHILDLVHPEDREKAVVALQQGRESPEVMPELLIRARHRDGSFRVLEVRGRKLLNNPVVTGAVLTSRDVTDRVRLEEERQQAVSLLRSTLESIHEGILVVDLEGAVKTFNQRFLDLWRIPVEVAWTRSNEELLGIAAEQLVDPDAFMARSLSIFSDRTAESHDILTFKDGRIIERHSQPQRLGDAVVGRVASFREVTELRRSEEEARESRAFLRTVIDASPNLVFVQDQDGRYTMANQTIAKLFGTTVEQMLGRTDEDLGMPAEEVERFRREDLEVIESGQSRVFSELPVTDPITGETRWYQKTKVPLYASSPDSVQVLGVATDITERVRAEKALHDSEERYRLIRRATNDLIYDWKIPTGEVEWNGAASVFGHPVEGFNADAEWFFEHLHPEDRHPVESSLDRSFREGGDFWSCEYRFLRADGSYATVLDRGHIVRDAAGEPVRMHGAMMDLTERRQLEEELQEAQKMEAVGRLAGGVAHELNNALMEIKGNAQLGLVDLPPGDARRAEYEAIEQAVDRAASLTYQLVAFGRKQVLQPKVIELNELVRGMETPLRRQAGEDIRVVTRLDSRRPSAEADPSCLEEVLRNLVLNAIQAMPEGGTVRIETGMGGRESPSGDSQTDPPLRYAWLSVSDTGTGMDERTLKRIWEPFFTTREGRSGLGLSTVYGIVKQSGGEIRAQSTPGEGSTFTVRLPAAPGGGTGAHGSGAPAGEEGGADTILLVEDEAGVRHVARRVLERAGYRVIEAASAEEALRIVEQQGAPVRLLLTDVVLPGMSGPQLARRLATVRPRLKTIFMSGYTADEFSEEDLIQSAVAFIPKPFDLRVLVEQVRDALEVD